MDPLQSAVLEVGRGVAGSAGRSSTRQITIISSEAWQAMMHELSADIAPSARRANVMVTGLNLAASRGRILCLGAARIRVRGETRPCELMDAALPGLRLAMDPQWRGGVFGEVIEGGEVRVGEPALWAPA
ncbi:MAG: MOSC domain-containing protein [Gemmatimonadota bacterium]